MGPALTYKQAIEALHDAPEVDGMIVHLFAGFGIWFLNMKEIMSGVKEPRKPILFWLIGHRKGRGGNSNDPGKGWVAYL